MDADCIHVRLLCYAPGARRRMTELILIVDDEPGILSTLGGILSDEGYSTLTTTSGEEALSLYQDRKPAVVFLDIWLADRDGLETLEALRETDPTAAVVMMSGHGTTSTAVKAIKMGAYDYLEKPLSYKRAVEAAAGALAYKRSLEGGAGDAGEILAGLTRDRGDRLDGERRFTAPPALPLLAETGRAQRTIQHSTVVYGLGLHSGQRTGMVLQPLPENSGIHFVTLPTGVEIPAHVRAVADTDYATTLGEGESIRTVEHLLSALHAYGVSNLLIKVHGEIPVLDGSALEFCKILEEVGVAEQDEPQREVVIDRRYEVGGTGEKVLAIEPADGFSVSYLLRYPPPVGEQSYEFTMTSADGLQAGDRSGPHLRLHEGPQNAQRARPGLGRKARQLHPGRRGRSDQHRPPLPGRIRPPQDPGHHRRPLPAGLSHPRQGHRPPDRPPGQHCAVETDRGGVGDRQLPLRRNGCSKLR